MNNSFEKELKKYYVGISKELTCCKKKKREFLNSIKKNVNDYCEEHPGATPDDIITHFGTPSEIARAYYDNESVDEIKSHINFSHKIFIAVVIFLISALLIYIVVIVSAMIHSMASDSSYSETVITEYASDSVL